MAELIYIGIDWAKGCKPLPISYNDYFKRVYRQHYVLPALKRSPSTYSSHLEALKCKACRLVTNRKRAVKIIKRGNNVIWSNELNGWLWW